MLFSSLLFLYRFLPLVLLVVLLSKKSWQNGLLLIASLIFYAWGGVSFTLLLILSILLNYFLGIYIDKHRGRDKAKHFLYWGVGLNLLLLILFKYSNFLVDNLNIILQGFNIPMIKLAPIPLPLGISFFTFQAISYIVDVYKERSFVQKKLPDLALYIALFPQLIAGPIVRYHDIAQQIVFRTVNLEKLSAGIERFIVGLGKKVLLANNFAIVADEIFASNPQNLDPLTAWFGLLCYTLQIYFDFSGYSDMAIGLGRMFGFEIPENFNFPYIAKSIREFWRRWHISLSNWFRDYLYVPLGGNRLSAQRTYFNLFIVFLLTGLWHGASWNFVFWGLFHGFFILIERLGFDALLKQVWAPLAHIYTLLVVMLAWVFFRADSFAYGWSYCLALFGLLPESSSNFDLFFYFNYEFNIALIIGLLASTPIFKLLNTALKTTSSKHRFSTISYDTISSISLFLIFLYCSMNLVNSSYNPFIYFRF